MRGDPTTVETTERPVDEPRVGGPGECPECAGEVVQQTTPGETVCADCGLVITDEEVDHGPEWRAFDAGERDAKSRVGAPTTNLRHDRGLSTTISWQDRDAFGRLLSPRKREQLRRLRTWNRRFQTRDSRDRNLKHALGELNRMASALGICEPTRETASVVYRRALDEELLVGRSIEGMATAALYAATRIDGVARSVGEVTAVSRVQELEVQRAYRYLVRELGLEIPPTDPAEFIGRLASTVGCSDETERLARELTAAATEQGVHSGKHPAGIAASALYAAATLCNDEITQPELSAAADVSTVTIRNRYPEVLEAAGAAEGTQ